MVEEVFGLRVRGWVRGGREELGLAVVLGLGWGMVVLVARAVLLRFSGGGSGATSCCMMLQKELEVAGGVRRE